MRRAVFPSWTGSRAIGCSSTTNPALFISSYKEYMDKIRVNASSANSLDVTLTLDEGTSARFVLKDITFGDKKGKSDFTMDVKSLPDSYIITDLR